MRHNPWLMVCRHFILLILPGVLTIAPAQNSKAATHSKLWKQDRQRLATAIAQGKKEVLVLIGSVPGQNQKVARTVKEFGGSIEYEADEVDYLRVRVPVEAVEKIAGSLEVQAICIDGNPIYWNDFSGAKQERAAVTDKAADEPTKTPSPPGPDTPAENPYVATRDIGAPQFIARHPTFDGRGVTVALVESTPDFLIPELQTAKNLKGEEVRKIAGMVDISADVEKYADETWVNPWVVNMEQEVRATGRQFTFERINYIAPADGLYRFGFFKYEFLSAIAKEGKWKDLQLYEDAVGSPRPIAVLWDENSGNVWVDTNQTHDFTDEKPMRDFNAGGDIGVFGHDNPATPWRESIGFVVLTNPEQHGLRLELGYSWHTTATAVNGVGKAIFGGKMNGVAPEARLFLVQSHGQHGLIEGTLLLMRNPSVDVLWNSTATERELSDGTSVLPLIWSRIVTHYRKPVFAGASNTGPGSNTISEHPSSPNVIAVGAYINKDTWWSNFGQTTTRSDSVINLSSRGPSANGTFKPDLVAPVGWVSPADVYRPTQMSPGGYKLPPGWRAAQGTSHAGPAAAGAAALLISAAKQSGVPYDFERLRWAMMTSARYLEGWGAHAQGAGLIDVPRAWEFLRHAPEPIHITSRGPVSYIFGRYLQTPNEGPGIYEREGWKAGESRVRSITFIRHDGSQRPVRYGLRWQGNDGTFQVSLKTIVLPLNEAVSLPVQVSPKATGIHSATLNLNDERTKLPVYRAMTTVVAAEELTTANGFRLEHDDLVEPVTYQTWFVRVPEGARELRLESPGLKGVTLQVFQPEGESHSKLSDDGDWTLNGHWMRAISNPAAGVWEIDFQQDAPKYQETDNESVPVRAPQQSPVSLHIAASVIGVEHATSAPDAPTLSGSDPNHQVTFLNRYGDLKGDQIRAAMGALRSETITLTREGGPLRHEIEVEPGTSSLEVSLAEPNQAADVDLYLYRCTDEKGGCIYIGSSTTSGSEESLRINNPRAGKWVAVIDPYDVPEGQARVRYQEVMTNPRYGEAKVSRPPSDLAMGQSWQVEVTPEIRTMPEGDRQLAAIVSVGDGVLYEYEKALVDHFNKTHPYKSDPADVRLLDTAVIPMKGSSPR